MDTDICNVYRKLCYKYKISADEFILSCLYNASVYNELNLRSTTINDISCSLLAETLKLVPIIKILNLSDCLLSFDGLKSFLDAVNQLNNLSHLILKGNQIKNNLTICISNIILNNSKITYLQLDWNNIGDSENTFAHFCDSLMSNTVLITLNLANNNLCQTCSIYLAKMLNINKCLKNIDLSWNCISETGALLLLTSLKNNESLIELNIQGNSVSEKTFIMIDEQLKKNKLNELSKTNIQNSNLNLIEHIVSVDKNYQTQLNSLNTQHHGHIDELQSKIYLLQKENQQQKQEIEELQKSNLKEKESNIAILNQVEKMKSDLSFNKQSLCSLVNSISDEISSSDIENMKSLEDLKKIIYIFKQTKLMYTNKIVKERKIYQKLSEILPKMKNELNIIKTELINLKNFTKIEINNYFDELIVIKKMFHTNIFHLQMSKKISSEIHLNNIIEQEEKLNISDKQTQMLVELNEELKVLHNEKKNLEIKLHETKTQPVINSQILRAYENSLILAKDELQHFNEKQLSNIAVQNSNIQLCANFFTKEIDFLKVKLIEKDQKLQNCEIEKQKLTIQLSTITKKFQSDVQNFEENKKKNQKEIEELYSMFTQYINKLK